MISAILENLRTRTHRSVTTFATVAGIALTFTLAAPLAPAHAVEEGDVTRGEAAYEANCASCHANAARITARVAGTDDAERAAALEAFLPDHYAEDDQDRADIIAYMLSL
jgi:mono/diheme cytochrome c family protein